MNNYLFYYLLSALCDFFLKASFLKSICWLVFSLGVSSVLADETFTVSGSIQSSDGTPLSNVELGISNQDLDTQTDASGLYSANLASGLPYMLSTYKAGYIFSPQYHYVDSLSSAERVDFSAIAVPESNADPKCVFYYPNWAVYTRDFQVHDIPADYMSHINYAFLMPFVAEGSLAVGDPVAIRENRGGVVIQLDVVGR